MSRADRVARLIDHTLLRPDATAAQVAALCDEAALYRFASVCVNPVWVRAAAARLAGSEVRVCSVSAFPLGAMPTDVKVFEARRVVEDGAAEVDVVLNLGALKAGETQSVADDIAAIVESVQRSGVIVKAIIETALLDDDQKVSACLAAVAGGAAFVKTSTGFAAAGASASDVALMRRVVGPSVGVKAAGGIRDLATLERMLDAGANRIGTSAGVAILREIGAMSP